MTTNEYYYDDIVIHTDKKSSKASIGLVTKDKPFVPYFKLVKKPENGGKSNETNDEIKKESTRDISIISDGSDTDDDDSDDGNLYDPPQVVSVNVDWFIHHYIPQIIDCQDKTYITSIPGENISLMDRSLGISDIVKCKVNGDFKVGCISDIKIYADVLVLGQNIVLKNVDCSKMKWPVPFMSKHEDCNFSYKNWLGEVCESTVDAIIRFSDGAKMRVPGTILDYFDCTIHKIWNLEQIMENTILEGDACNLRTRRSRFITETAKYNVKWLGKLKNPKMVQFILEQIIILSVDLTWIYSNSQTNSIVSESPPTSIKGRDLEKLELVDPYMWHDLTIGDTWYYPISSRDILYECTSDDPQVVLYKVMNEDLEVMKFDVPPSNSDNTERKTGEKDVVSGGGHVLKPRKKVISGTKLRSSKKRSQKQAQSTKYEDTDSDEDSDDSLIENVGKPKRKKKQDKKSDFNKEFLSKDILQKIYQATQNENDLSVQMSSYFPVGILTRRSFVDVHWQDGSVSYDMPIRELIPQTYNIDEHDFFPGDFVIQKFDPQQSKEIKDSMHSFGTVIESNTKDRVAKVQWFDYCPQLSSSIVKCGDPEEVGVYDISALNEHHFIVGSKVIIKPESTRKHYPAGYVVRQAPEHGQLIIRWPDGIEEGISPTELLLTVDSILADDDDEYDEISGDPDYAHLNGSDNDSCFSDYLTSSDLDSDSAGVEKPLNNDAKNQKNADKNVNGDGNDVNNDDDDEFDSSYVCDHDSDWETTDEQDCDPLVNEYYKKSLAKAKIQLLEVKENIAKVNSKLLKNLATFSTTIRSNLPPNMALIMNIPKMYPDLNDPNETDKKDTLNDQALTGDDQVSMRLFFDIRQDIGVIYNSCSDVEIKGMFRRYRPRDILCLRSVKNFLISHVNFNQSFGTVNNTTNDNTDSIIETDSNTLYPESYNEESVLKDSEVHKFIGDHIKLVYVQLKANLKDLDESINAWLWEKSYYLRTDEAEDNKENVENNFVEPNTDGVTQDESIKPPVVKLENVNEKPTDTDKNKTTEKSREITKRNSITTGTVCDPIPIEQRGKFELLETAPSTHRYLNHAKPSMSSSRYQKAWKRDLRLLATSLPRGVVVKSFDDRTDLFSLMIVGPDNTPYQHALFFFDMQLGPQYPTQPPSVYYQSMAPERVNPNLYTEGRVCLSLLGTWNGKGTENWDSKLSSLLQIIVSLQGLILVSEPYYNEAGFEIRRGSEEGQENSQRYNENAISNVCQSMINLLHKPFETFKNEIYQHFKEHGQSLISTYEYWASLDAQKCSESQSEQSANQIKHTDFLLAPVSRGFQLTLRRHLTNLQKALDEYISKWTDTNETAPLNDDNVSN